MATFQVLTELLQFHACEDATCYDNSINGIQKRRTEFRDVSLTLAHRLSNDSLQPHDSNDKFTEPTIETFIIYRINYEDNPYKRNTEDEREMTVKKFSRCNSCGKFFDSKRELRKHIYKNHRITDSKISEAGINEYMP